MNNKVLPNKYVNDTKNSNFLAKQLADVIAKTIVEIGANKCTN